MVERCLMPSGSLQTWRTVRRAALDELAAAHRRVGGVGRGRRYATQQINQAYAVLLSSQFQGYCRDLHTESAEALVGMIALVKLRQTVLTEFLWNRKLDRGNPNPANLGSDFERLGIRFWVDVDAADSRNRQRRQWLATLNEWRNAIAHQDFDPVRLGGTV